MRRVFRPRSSSAPTTYALALAAALACAAGGALPAARAAAPLQTGEPSSCRDHDPATGALLSTRVVSPTAIALCETAAVTLTVRASCEAVPMHVMLDIDRSGSMVGQPLRDAQAAASALVDALDMRTNPDVRVGLVSHGDPPVVNVRPTNDASRVKSRINGLGAGGEDNLPRSIDVSRGELVRARRDVTTSPVEALVVLSDGGQTYPPESALGPAGAARGEGMLVVAVCLDNGASDCRTMRRIASSGRYYFETRSTGQLERIFTEIAEELSDISLRAVDVEEVLPEGLAYVAGSGVPEPAAVSADGRTLGWDLTFVGREGGALRYDIAPSRLGSFELATTTVQYADSRDRLGAVRVPTTTLEVARDCAPAPSPTPSPTLEPSPTPTNPALPSPTPTPTTTPTPSPTATRPPAPIYLPILGLGLCTLDERPADIVLAMDASTSMRGAAASGRTKIDAAKEAAQRFAALARTVDRVAVVRFSGSAEVVAPFDAGAAERAAAIAGIELSPGTRIDLALEASTAALAARRPDARGVVVLLTDGQPTGTTPDAVRAAAAAAREGALVYALGIGTDVDAALLADVAGAPERFLAVPDADALAAIYDAVREQIVRCPEGAEP